MGVIRFIEEAIMPLILYGLFSVICVYGAAKAIKRVKKLKNGKTEIVTAKIVDYRAEKIVAGRYKELRHFVTVEINDSIPKYITLSTNSSRAKRYKDLEQAEIYFIDGEEKPFLKEDIRHIYIDSVVGVIGGIICILFTALIMIAIIWHFIDKVNGAA